MTTGWIVSLLFFMPNLDWSGVVHRERLVPLAANLPTIVFLKVIEHAARAAVIVISMLSDIAIGGLAETAALGILTGALVVYDIGWLRYFRMGNSRELLFRPPLGLPMSFVVATGLFGAAHVVFSFNEACPTNLNARDDFRSLP